MKASIVDLRYRMNDVLRALDRNEDVVIQYHGKPRGVLTSCAVEPSMQVKEHPFFGMRREQITVAEEMDQLRGGRHRAL